MSSKRRPSHLVMLCNAPYCNPASSFCSGTVTSSFQAKKKKKNKLLARRGVANVRSPMGSRPTSCRRRTGMALPLGPIPFSIPISSGLQSPLELTCSLRTDECGAGRPANCDPVLHCFKHGRGEGKSSRSSHIVPTIHTCRFLVVNDRKLIRTKPMAKD